MKRTLWRRDFEKEQAWRAVMKRQGQSGLSIRAFCRRESISEPSFYAWRRELLQRDRESVGVRVSDGASRLRSEKTPSAMSHRAMSVTAAFLPVTITSGGDPIGRVLEVVCLGGSRLSAWPGCDATLLQAALSVLTAQAAPSGEGEATSC